MNISEGKFYTHRSAGRTPIAVLIAAQASPTTWYAVELDWPFAAVSANAPDLRAATCEEHSVYTKREWERFCADHERSYGPPDDRVVVHSSLERPHVSIVAHTSEVEAFEEETDLKIDSDVPELEVFLKLLRYLQEHDLLARESLWVVGLAQEQRELANAAKPSLENFAGFVHRMARAALGMDPNDVRVQQTLRELAVEALKMSGPPPTSVVGWDLFGTVPGVRFTVSRDGGRTGIYWRENVFECLTFLQQHPEFQQDYAVAAVNAPVDRKVGMVRNFAVAYGQPSIPFPLGTELERRNLAAFDLAARVLATAYEKTESWSDDQLGMHIAYLVLAITDQKPDSLVDWTEEECNRQPNLRVTKRLFLDWFPLQDPVWKYIQV